MFQLVVPLLFLCVLAEYEAHPWREIQSDSPDLIPIGTRSQPPKGWHKAQKAPQSHQITFIVSLKQQNLDKLEALFWDRSNPDSAQYQQWMTIEDINALVSPPTEIHNAVLVWLKDNKAKRISSFGDSIEATLTVKELESVLKTEFWVYKHSSGNQVVALSGDYHLPHHVAPFVEMIVGINSFPHDEVNIIKQKFKTSEGVNGIFDDYTYVVPQTTYQMYSIPTGTKASHGASQGVIEWENQFFSPPDLIGFGQNMAVTPLTNPIVVGINTPGEPGTEAELDIQWIAATGIGAQNWFWIEAGTTWLYGFAVHFANTAKTPAVCSMSYGWSEKDQCENGIGGAECNSLGVNAEQYVNRVNVEFMKIGLNGTTLFASAGDSGVYGRTDEFCTGSTFNPAFPAASPYVTAVGATEIRESKSSLPNPPPVCQSAEFWWCASSGDEQAVGWLTSGFASGGGFSVFSPTQPFQQVNVRNYLNSTIGQQTPVSYFNQRGRGFPDVAALGSRVLIWVGGGSESVGGTSASSPIFAGVFSLLNDYSLSQKRGNLGPANQLLYKMAADAPKSFTDITVGNNRCTESGCGLLDGCIGFNCAPGWDPVSGLGSPVYTEMLAYLKSKFE